VTLGTTKKPVLKVFNVISPDKLKKDLRCVASPSMAIENIRIGFLHLGCLHL